MFIYILFKITFLGDMIHDLQIASYSRHTKSNHLPSASIDPHYPLPAFTPLPSGNHHVVVYDYEFQSYMGYFYTFLAIKNNQYFETCIIVSADCLGNMLLYSLSVLD